jgi:hypothetical protein
MQGEQRLSIERFEKGKDKGLQVTESGEFWGPVGVLRSVGWVVWQAMLMRQAGVGRQ